MIVGKTTSYWQLVKLEKRNNKTEQSTHSRVSNFKLYFNRL